MRQEAELAIACEAKQSRGARSLRHRAGVKGLVKSESAHNAKAVAVRGCDGLCVVTGAITAPSLLLREWHSAAVPLSATEHASGGDGAHEWFATRAAVRSRCSSHTKQSSDTSTTGSMRSGRRTPLLLAWHCPSSLGCASEGRPARMQSCEQRRTGTIGVIQMSPKRERDRRWQEHECDSERWTITELRAGSGVWPCLAAADSSVRWRGRPEVVEMHASP